MQKNNRVWFLDEARGLLILLMVLHHGAYDAAYLLGWPLTFLSTGWFGVIRSCCAGGFVLICGCACRLSRSNLRRGVRCLILAAGLSFATAWLVPAQRIRFGVLHLLGCGMVLFALLQPLLDRIHPAAGAIAGFFLCFLTAKAPSGFLGIGPLRLALPGSWYRNAFTAALGFPPAGYFSADYFPLVPWLFLLLAGSFLGVWLRLRQGPPWMYRLHAPFLAAAGQRSLWIYLLHQPAWYAVFWLISRFF